MPSVVDEAPVSVDTDKESKEWVVITRKIQIAVLEPDSEKLKQKYELLRTWSHRVFKAANFIVSYQLFNNIATEKIKAAENLAKASEARDILKGILDTGIENSTYRLIAEKFPELPSMIRSSLNRKVVKAFSANYKDVLKGARSVSTYRLGMPIPFNLSDSMGFTVEQIEDKEQYVFTLTKDMKFLLLFGRDRSNNKVIVDRVMAGIDYKFCDSEIKVDGKDVYLLMTVKHKRAVEELDYSLFAATNLGMNSPIFVTTTNGIAKQIGSKEEFLNVRLQIQSRYRKLNAELVDARSGHGRQRKLKALDRLKMAEKGFATTYNHKISKSLIRFCVQNKIGNIITEDLLGASDTMDKQYVLRNWGYFQLQSQIEYKAKMVGINLIKRPNSYYTKTCNCCKQVSDTAVNLAERVYVCENAECGNFNIPVNIDENNSLNLLQSSDTPEESLPVKRKKKK